MVRLEIVVGIGFEKTGQPVENQQQKVTALRAEAGKLLGGFTFYPSFGGYINSGGTYVEEPGITIVAFQEDSPECRFAACGLVNFAKNLFNQESIAVGLSKAEFTLA
jgi:hypothetical protein